MCGIIGIIKRSNTLSIVEYFNHFRESLCHRGPDDYGEYISEEYGFAHFRLSIIDKAGGRQPILYKNKNMGIIYNGEIYNYKLLRVELENKGYIFNTNSDTEVILFLVADQGIESIKKLRGMFSFCIWDENVHSVYLARDQFGIKPLYVYFDDQKIIFSSEIKAIINLPGISLNIDLNGVTDYFKFRYIQSPYTLFKNISKIPAGNYLKISSQGYAHFCYHDINFNHNCSDKNEREIICDLQSIISDSVQSHLMSEVPVGLLLSGGIDSSILAYFISKSGAKLKTFNVGFESTNEFEYSSLVAEYLGLEHIQITVSLQDVIQNFHSIVTSLDEPIADPACFPLFLLCKEIKNHVTVLLSGEGSDEIFAGYNQYYYSMVNQNPYEEQFDNFLRLSFYFENYREFILANDKADVSNRYAKYFYENSLLSGMLAYDMKTWVPENLMMKADKIMMAHSLEGRFPFLDTKLIEYVSNIPEKFKINKNGVTKYILKEMMREHLPTKIIERNKMGFSVPIDLLLIEMKIIVLESAEKLKNHPISKYVNVERVSDLFTSYYNGKKQLALQVWSQFILIYWLLNQLPTYKDSKMNYLLPGRKKYSREYTLIKTPDEKEKTRVRISNEFIMGDGIEIGALHCPLQVDVRKATVRYVDLCTLEELKSTYPELENFTIKSPDIIDNGEILSKVPDNSLDFIVANHFLEHTQNPIGTIRNHLKKLREKGVLYYAIPNKKYTFDKSRPITCFEHLIDDDRLLNNEKLLEHYLEWADLVDKVQEDKAKMEHALTLLRKNIPIHFHVWDVDGIEEFFNETQRYLNNSFIIKTFSDNYDEIIVILEKRTLNL